MDSINKFDDFLNCSSEFEDLMKVREYRHMAYKQWLSVVKEIESLCQQLAERDALIAKKDEGLQSVADLINESAGVTGLHLNGDIAYWDSLRTSGRFEEWLFKFDEALALKPKELG